MSKKFVKTEAAREGRTHQVYNSESGARVVAGCIALSDDNHKLIMITSSKHKDRWILPKGGVEDDEAADYSTSAQRETWEEAGVVGKITRELKTVHDYRFRDGKQPKDTVIDGEPIPKSEFHFFEMQVTELATEWPEGARRRRRWCTYSEAKHELTKAKRLELIEALNDSNIVKDVPAVAIGTLAHQVDQHQNADEY